MQQYLRASLEVKAEQYEVGKNMEDGFELWSSIVINGWILTDGLVKIRRSDGSVVCPYIKNKRGVIFIREGDYIIYESDNQRHVCGAASFKKRYISPAGTAKSHL